LTQQAVSKRVAALERELGVKLFTRTARGAQLTIDGQAFLPHARELLATGQRALDSVLPGRRALRVDVISSRVATNGRLREFHAAHPEVDLDVVMIPSRAEVAFDAIEAGTIDATLRAVVSPGALPDGFTSVRVHDDRHELLTGPGHVLADARSVTMAQLVDHRIWMPGVVEGTEWAAYYAELTAAFGVTIDAIGPNFGSDALLETIAGSSTLATLIGAGMRLVWPAAYGLRRIPVVDPTPVYPSSLVWRADNAHPAIPKLRDYFLARRAEERSEGTWAPAWAA
jgi:DNA-binding transcriptional LysR family regulator